MIYFYLFKEFFKIGVLSFGGGYATLPFLYHIIEKYHWYTIDDLSQMLAIASVTPGPIGINMATYAGMKTQGALGSLTATLSIILPSIFIVILVSKLIKKFSDNFIVKSALYGLKPASCALITTVAIKMIMNTIVGIKEIAAFIFLLLILTTQKKSPVFYIILSALIGLIVISITKIQ